VSLGGLRDHPSGVRFLEDECVRMSSCLYRAIAERTEVIFREELDGIANRRAAGERTAIT